MLEYCSFHPVKKSGSLIGFCSFKFNKEFQFTEIAVHKLKEPKGNVKVRLLYPEKISPAKEVQMEIDEDMSAYISANYNSALKGK